jgi:DNA repair protein RadD
MKARDYQEAAVAAVWDYFRTKSGNPILALPTGTGKSFVQADLTRSMLLAYPTTKVICLTHVKELIENNYKTFLRIMPTAPAGVYSAGLGRRDVHAQVTFAGIASVAKRAKLFRDTDIIMIDECHLVSDNDSAMYAKFIAAVRAYNPALKVIGLSATPFRLGTGMLTDGQLFDDICFDLTSGPAFLWMLAQGYLAPLVPKKPQVMIDTSSVGIRGGEFVQSALTEQIDQQNVIGAALWEARGIAADRNHWLVFASSIEHTERITEMLNEMDIPAAFVHSKMSNKDRDAAIAGFRDGTYRALVNKDILTTGFDFPHIDCILMLRPTQSPGLWVQMLGRGTRPVFASGFDLDTPEGRLAAIAAGPKRNCLVLDFAGNTERLGPINYPTIPKKRGKGSGEPPTRVCPECATYVHISVRVCPECGHEFPREEKVAPGASTSALIAGERPQAEPKQVEVFAVDRVIAVRHQKAGKPDSVRVSYYCGSRRFTDFVGVEHSGFMKMRARKWWALHAPVKNAALPRTTTALLDVIEHIRVPTHIKVVTNLKYPEIIAYDFTGSGFEPNPRGLLVVPGQGAGPAPAADRGPDRGRPPAPELPDMHEFR